MKKKIYKLAANLNIINAPEQAHTRAWSGIATRTKTNQENLGEFLSINDCTFKCWVSTNQHLTVYRYY